MKTNTSRMLMNLSLRRFQLSKEHPSVPLYEEFEDTIRLIRIGKSKKNRQHNGQKKKYKRTHNYLPNIHIKLKTRGELRCSGKVSSSCSTSDTHHVNCFFLSTPTPLCHFWYGYFKIVNFKQRQGPNCSNVVRMLLTSYRFKSLM